jgi:hypothetical protein
MTAKTWFTAGFVALLTLGVLIPATVCAQDAAPGQEPGSVQQQQRPSTQEGPAYDAKSEATFIGTVADVKGGRSALYWFSRIHTLGMGHMRAPDKQLLLKTDTEIVEIYLGPAAFLSDQKVDIDKGDTVEVIGSRVTRGDSEEVVLAREVRKGNDAWTLRDAAGQPLWSSAQTDARGFWTTKKVLVAAVVAKVVLLATVLRH